MRVLLGYGGQVLLGLFQRTLGVWGGPGVERRAASARAEAIAATAGTTPTAGGGVRPPHEVGPDPIASTPDRGSTNGVPGTDAADPEEAAAAEDPTD
jgi:hypothetical protein